MTAAVDADSATAVIVGHAGGVKRYAFRSQTITASAPAVARVVLQVASAPAPADATRFSVIEVTFFRLRIKGHVADAHTLVVVSEGPRGDQRGDGSASNELQRSTPAEGALSHSACQLVEGVVGSFLAHLLPPLPKGRATRGP
jgi:hypothetical protein